MVRSIRLEIPPGAEVVDDPAEDTALMAWIGAKRIGDECGEDYVSTKYELKNAPTGKRFTFTLRHSTRGSQRMLDGFNLLMDA